jgi:peptidoglycan/LPS O-acetylase OafA/YrhL
VIGKREDEIAGQAPPDVAPHGPASSVVARPVEARPRPARQLWADLVRVAAVLMIFLYHFTPDWLKSTATQPNAAEQFIRDHFAQWGIAAFVVLSGFSLALTLSISRASTAVYFSRRLTRILSPFWAIAIPFALVGFALGEETWAELWKLPIWLLGLGPASPATFQPISEAWWYVSLALQIGLVIPLLMRIRRSIGLVPLAVFSVFVNAAALAAVGLIRPEWKHLALSLVICRLAELMIGMAAAELVLAGRGDRRRVATALASIGFVMAVSPLLDLLGMWTSWQATVGLAILFAVGALLAARAGREPPAPVESPRRAPTRVAWRLLAWAAGLSYCFYLSHAPISKYSGRLLAKLGLHNTLLALPLVLIVCVLVAWVADWAVKRWVTPRVSALFDRLLVYRGQHATPVPDNPQRRQ